MKRLSPILLSLILFLQSTSDLPTGQTLVSVGLTFIIWGKPTAVVTEQEKGIAFNREIERSVWL